MIEVVRDCGEVDRLHPTIVVATATFARYPRTDSAIIRAMRITALVLASSLVVAASPGCATTSYKISNAELQRLAQLPPEQRGEHVRVVQQLSDADVGPPQPVTAETQIVIFPQVVVYDGGGRRRGSGWGPHANLGGGTTAHGSGGVHVGSGGHGGGSSGGGGDGKAEAIAILVIAATVLVIAAAGRGLARKTVTPSSTRCTRCTCSVRTAAAR